MAASPMDEGGLSLDEERRRWAIDRAIHARTYEANYVKIVDLAKEIEGYVKGSTPSAD